MSTWLRAPNQMTLGKSHSVFVEKKTHQAGQSIWVYSTSLEYSISRSIYLNKGTVKGETKKDPPQEIYSLVLFRAAGNPPPLTPFPHKTWFQILFSMSHWQRYQQRFLDLVIRHGRHLLPRVYYQKAEWFTVKLSHTTYTPPLTLHCIRN